MSSFSFTISGAESLNVTLTELEDGSVRFDLANAGPLLADLRGLFFDVNNAGLLSSLSVVGTAVTTTQFRDDGVTNVGGGVNMNGLSSFDVGVAFGTSGIGKDDISSTSFVLKSSAGALSLADFANVDFGVRFTSVGEDGGSRDGSLKILGHSPDAAPPPPDIQIAIVPDYFQIG